MNTTFTAWTIIRKTDDTKSKTNHPHAGWWLHRTCPITRVIRLTYALPDDDRLHGTHLLMRRKLAWVAWVDTFWQPLLVKHNLSTVRFFLFNSWIFSSILFGQGKKWSAAIFLALSYWICSNFRCQRRTHLKLRQPEQFQVVAEIRGAVDLAVDVRSKKWISERTVKANYSSVRTTADTIIERK